MGWTSPPAAGWHPDPSGAHELRWWDGERWADGVSDDGVVSTDALDPAGAEAAWEARRDQRAQWPGWVAGAALAGMALGVAIAVLLAIAVDALGGGSVMVLAAGVVGLYGILIATCVIVSRRAGSGRGFAADFGLRFWRVDVAWGLLLGLVARVASVVVALPFVLLDDDLAGSNLPTEEDIGGDLALAIGFFVMAVAVAPIVEELFFRGLLQRALETMLPAWGAIALAAMLFGLAHASLELGPGNVTVVAATATGGAVFGFAARRFHRLGPPMAAHAWFNLPAAVAIFWIVS